MQEEIEVKFFDVDFDDLRTKLEGFGATCTMPMALMRRAIMDYPDKRLHNMADSWSWIRVRDEGARTTVTFKSVDKDGSKKTGEIEYEASSYKLAVALFEAIGLETTSVQETKREIWKYKDCEIMLDEWPWIPLHIEIEGPSIESLQTVAEDLGLDWANHFVGNADFVYEREYPGMKSGDTIGEIPELTFDTMPQWLKDKK